MIKHKIPLIIGSILGIGLFVVLLLLIISIPDIKSEGRPTAVLLVTPYEPTATAFTQAEVSSEDSVIQPTSIPGVFSIDMQVRVSNTGGDGLKVHSEPAIESDTLTIASENSVWIIIEGPILKDGRIWWKILSESSQISGWAVQDYLNTVY